MPTTDQLNVALADRYRIERELGQGGMATVFLAEDLRHKRRVALKVLKPELAAVLGAERFLQEITTTAALQHPHILPLFDSGEANGFLYYVMPFIDGETLRARLNRETQLGVEDAVRIASDVASALHYAHTHGVIHRDIKPENILLHDGRPMVADFGIALAVSAAAGGRMTETGLSLGTPHYMSPEQATAEKEITARSDVYSLGTVLYEMLAGDPPHTGSSAQQIIMKIITEPAAPVTQLRKSVPENVAATVAKSLEKLPADRFASAAAFATALQDRGFTTTHAQAHAARGPAARRLKDPLFVGVSVLAFVAGAFVVRSLLQPLTTLEPGVVRFEIAGGGAGHPVSGGSWPATVSPDGRTIVYTGETSNGSSQFYVRQVGEIEARPLAGTDNPMEPFFSPNGKWLGFWADNELKKMQLDGSTPIRLTGVTDVNGAAWTNRGTIVIGSTPPQIGLVVVAEADGRVSELTKATRTGGEGKHVWPVMLGDSQHVAFTISNQISNDKAQLAVTSLDDGVVHRLGVAGVRPIGEVGSHLIYLTPTGVVMAVPLDASRERATGAPVALLDSRIRMCDECNGDGPISLSNGALLYMPGSRSLQMTWVDRRGVELDAMRDKKAFSHPRRSPDGRRIAVEVNEGGHRDIWIYDVSTGTGNRLTVGGDNKLPEWTDGGTRIVFVSDRGGRWDIWSQPADFSTEAARLHESKGERVYLAAPSPDRQTILYSGNDITTFSISGGATPRTYLNNSGQSQITAFQFSPDGKSVAYSSSESGQFEIVVRSFPNPGAKLQISNGGGVEPRWSGDGRQVFYANGSRLMVATLATTPALHVIAHDSLFRAPFLDQLTPGPASYDVSSDGARFLMLKPNDDRRALVVVLNWASEVAARLRAK